MSGVADLSFSPFTGRRWPEGPDEGLGEFAQRLVTLPLTLALSPQAGRGNETAHGLFFSPFTGRRWPIGPDECSSDFAQCLVTMPLTLTLSPHAGRGNGVSS
jgi:hypothetical protein